MKIYLVWEIDTPNRDMLEGIFSTAEKAERYTKDLFAREFPKESKSYWDRYYWIQERDIE